MGNQGVMSAAQARATALAAQGFADPPPAGRPGGRALARVLRRVGLLQIDSVNVLVRAHYLPVFSRLGDYPVGLLDADAGRRPRALFEYWAHEASLLPVRLQPYLRWRMAEAAEKAWGGLRSVAKERPELVAEVLAYVAAHGPVTAGELERSMGGPATTVRSGPWWDWRESKRALEYLFWTGEITAADRRNFERRYDLAERVLPTEVLAVPTPERADAQRELVRVAAGCLGVATEPDLRDYFRIGPAESRRAVAELVEAGDLLPVEVEGWGAPGYLAAGARVPRRVGATALLAPFDPLVWFRPRVMRIFGFRYRLEIYTPAPKRVHGYYVLPFLHRGRLVGRVDLKADRQAGVLRVPGAFAEPSVRAPGEVAEALVTELARMAGWLGLDGVVVGERGDLAPALLSAGAGRPARPGSSG